MINPSVTVVATGLPKLLADGGAAGLLEGAIEAGLNKIAQDFVFEILPKVPIRSGRLRQSIDYRMIDSRSFKIGSMQAGDGEPVIYAAVQEFGGTITGNPWLAIPINYPGNPVVTKAGVAKAYARDVRANPQEFGFQGTFVAKGIVFGVPPTGGGVKGIGGKWNIVPLFKLQSSVTIKGKFYISSVVNERALPRIMRSIEDEVRARLDELGG